jgi:hypothetical protein
MENELLRTLGELPLHLMAVGAVGGAAAGWGWQHFRGVVQFSRGEGGVFQDIRPSLRAEKSLNAIQGGLAGIGLALSGEMLWEGSWEECVALTVGIALPYLLRAALDTDRLPPGVKRRK